jgi:DNA-directed RNA polymerase subunit RPC12/RpoP
MKVVCEYCGRKIKEDSESCNYCGGQVVLKRKERIIQSLPKYCEYCGGSLGFDTYKVRGYFDKESGIYVKQHTEEDCETLVCKNKLKQFYKNHTEIVVEDDGWYVNDYEATSIINPIFAGLFILIAIVLFIYALHGI